MGDAIKHNVITIVLIIIFVILASIGVVNHTRVNEISTQAKVASSEAQTEQKAYDKKYVAVHKTFFRNDVNSKDPKVKSMALNHLAISDVDNPVQRFFNVFYTYKDHQSYVQRASELHNLATSNVLDNKNIFNDDRDVSGDSIVESEQLNSEFISAHPYIISHNKTNINLIVDTSFKAWSAATDDQKTGEEGYEMNYNTTQNKFTSLKKIYHISNVSNPASD